ncbi:MAG: hypothetical protein DME02_20835 [Candidatus Rokuibacteriota bacterium]|nr:MAG: hypothetical protein DME02_20835 [Candidatus Rokubacteria bacterium]
MAPASRARCGSTSTPSPRRARRSGVRERGVAADPHARRRRCGRNRAGRGDRGRLVLVRHAAAARGRRVRRGPHARVRCAEPAGARRRTRTRPASYAARQWAPARGAYEIAAARGASPTVRALARTSIGYTWEAERDWAKAIETFQAVARELGPRDFLFDEVQFALARVQELGGKPADAITTYERVLKDTPTAPRIEEAKQQLMRLGASRNK